MASGRVEGIKESLRRAAAALREANVAFLVGGGLASWGRGGPESGHDVDIIVKPEDAERALQVLVDQGMRPERPPEGWLLKAYDGDVMIDIIFEPSGIVVDDEMMARGDDLELLAVPMRVMSLEDLLISKLASLREHSLQYDSVLEISRSLREQIDWEDVHARAPDNPYVAEYFTLIEGLGIIPGEGPARGLRPVPNDTLAPVFTPR